MQPWTTFPLHPIRPDGSCGCGDPTCKDVGKHPCVRWGAKTLGAGVAVPIPPGFGVGVATGARSGIIGLDLDRKNGLDGLAALQLLGDIPETLAVATPTGGLHLYLRHPGFPVPNSASVLGPGIDVRGDGGYLVLPPSSHRVGGRYEWIDPNVPIAEAPAWLLELLKHGPRKMRAVKHETLERLAKLWRKSKSVTRQELGQALERVTKGESFALPGERDTLIFDLARDLAKALPDAEPKSLAEHFTTSLDLMEREAPDCPTVDVVLEKLTRAYAETQGEGGAWTQRMATSENGLPKACLGNAVLVLENHPAWTGVLAYDERRGREVFVLPPPWGGDVPRDLTDADATECAKWLTEFQRMTIGKSTACDALDAVAHQKSFDRVRDYLEALHWDGVPRLDGWLVQYAAVTDTPFARTVGAKFVLSAVARALDPGCKVDTMLILEGKQGILKSSLLRALFGAENFADDLPDIETKDAKDHLRGPWGIEIKELQAFDRKETNAIKGFIDQRRDRFRQAYGAKTNDYERRCVFAGTTNAEEYLKDWTGNRRYWPVRVGSRCDVPGLDAARDALWAEAVARYRAGEAWWLDDAQEQVAEQEQAKREEVDVWTESVLVALDEGVKARWSPVAVIQGQAPTPMAEWAIPPNTADVSVAEVLEYVIKLPTERWTRGHEMRVSAILRQARWERRRIGGRGEREWRYFRPRPNPPGSGFGVPTSTYAVSGSGAGDVNGAPNGAPYPNLAVGAPH